jgi:hypothetical protein
MRKTTSLISRCLPHAIACACALALAAGAQAATWTKLKNKAPGDGSVVMFQLTDGTIMVKTGDSSWARLTPDAKGSYVNGTWSALADMSECRYWFTSHVLRTGNLWILGGEYTGAGCPSNWSNTGELYDTVKDKWSPVAHHPESSYGDVPSMMLDGDKIMTGSLQTNKTWVYDIASDSWTAGPTKFYNDRSDEEGWAKIHGGQVIVYDLFISVSTGTGHAEIWDPSTNAWTGRTPSDGSATGTLPLLSSSAVGFEMGPTLALRSKKNKDSVFAVGANGHTAMYNVPKNSWAAMPDLNDTLNGKQVLFGADDAPGAEMPSGNVVFAADTGPTNGTFTPPTHLFEFNPDKKTIASITSSFPDQNYLNTSSYETQMIMLPTGEMLFGNGTTVMYIYAPDGKAEKGSRPRFMNLHYNGDGTFLLKGRQITGVSAGATYGDDAQYDASYPIVRLTDTDSNVFYGRTTMWSTTEVQDKRPETVTLTLNKGMTAAGNYDLEISAAGVSSKPTCVVITSAMISGTGSAGDVKTCN